MDLLCRHAEWQSGKVAELQSGKVAKWQGCRVAELQSGSVITVTTTTLQPCNLATF